MDTHSDRRLHKPPVVVLQHHVVRPSEAGLQLRAPIGLHVLQRPTGEQEATVHVCRTRPKNEMQAYVPDEADETGDALPRTFLGLAGNQPLKRGGYLLMGRMAGPDPLFRLHSSTFTSYRPRRTARKGRKRPTPMFARRSSCTNENTPTPSRSSRCHRCQRRAERCVAVLTKHIHQSI